MGATTFFDVVNGKDAKSAFAVAVEEAAYENGHGGYTGTIAEKSEFTMIPLPFKFEDNVGIKERIGIIETFTEKLIEERDPRIDDKWGPAGCIEIIPGKYLFFGWASE